MAARRRRVSSPINPLGSLVFTAGIAAFALLLFVTTRLLTDPEPQRWIGDPPAVGDEAVDAAPFEERLEAVTRRLEKGPLRAPTPIIQSQGSGAVRYLHRLYEITLSQDEGDKLAAALEHARADDPTVVVGIQEVEGGRRGEIGVDGLLTHTLLIAWKAQPTPPPPRVAVVVDDMGNNLLVARDLVSLPYPVALAVIPFRPFSREVAQSAHQRGREVLLHLPMEARSGEESGEIQVLRVSDEPSRVITVLDQSLGAVPHAIGVNNHMGSRFTEDPDRMRLVLERLRQHNLFFLDSLTTSRSVARVAAVALGLPYAARAVFLDDDVDADLIRRRLQELLERARRDGAAIGIGHPHPETVAALREFGEMAEKAGVQIVPVSTLVSVPTAP